MNFFRQFKFFGVYFLTAALLLSSGGCSYKPAYLQKARSAQVAQRWKVEKINPSKLSPEEMTAFEKMGSPQYVRFYRKLDPDRERVYEWVYTGPIRLVFFQDGKRVDYIVVDDNPSPFNEYQKKVLFWGGVTTAAAVALGVLSYYLTERK